MKVRDKNSGLINTTEHVTAREYRASFVEARRYTRALLVRKLQQVRNSTAKRLIIN